MREMSAAFASQPAIMGTQVESAMAELSRAVVAPPSLALMSSMKTMRETFWSARELNFQLTLAAAPSIQTTITEMFAAQRSSLQAVYNDLRSNQALFTQSSEVLRALRESVISLEGLGSTGSSGLDAALQNIHLDQRRFRSLVESLAIETIGDLEPAEAHGLASAFQDAVSAQTIAARNARDNGAADHAVQEELRQRIYEELKGHRPADKGESGTAIPSIDRLINILMFLLTLASYYDGKANTREITSRQNEANAVLRALLQELPKHLASPAPAVRIVDRNAPVFQRPAKGSAVIAVVGEGAQVVITGMWGRWVEVTYVDAAAELTRSGWVLKKYLE
jgi:hypothetical protein